MQSKKTSVMSTVKHLGTGNSYLADQLADLPPWYWHLVVKNANFTFLLLGLILVDQVVDLPPIVESGGQE